MISPKMSFVLPAITLYASALAVAPAAESQVTWQGVTLSAPASTLRSLLGDPLRIVVPENGRPVARYWIAGSDSAYLLVLERNGYVTGFEVFTDSLDKDAAVVAPDPSGVRLGDSMDTVKAKHPDFHQRSDEDGNPFMIGRISSTLGAVYTFQNGRVRMFQWAALLASSLPELAAITVPPGDSPSTAILDIQKNETDGAAWEYRFLSFHPCSDKGRWQLKTQALIKDQGRSYDRLHVFCSDSKAERDFYFDISSFFGKL